MSAHQSIFSHGYCTTGPQRALGAATPTELPQARRCPSLKLRDSPCLGDLYRLSTPLQSSTDSLLSIRRLAFLVAPRYTCDSASSYRAISMASNEHRHPPLETHCIKCQITKVRRNTVNPLGTFTPLDARFSHDHLDLAGSLPLLQNCRYMLTCVDRLTR
ncbi:hypothetical protein MRX96_048009 [Rhipicephalus microplus]